MFSFSNAHVSLSSNRLMAQGFLENLDFSRLVADPIYRRTMRERSRVGARSSKLRSLIDEIKALDPGVDLSNNSMLQAFATHRSRQPGGPAPDQRFVGAGLMLIALIALIGLVGLSLLPQLR